MRSNQIDLSELIRIIQSNGSKQANSIFTIKEKDTKIRRLARKFAFEKDRDERAWAYEICDGPENSTSYILHRSILKRQLLSQTFHLEPRTGSERRKAIYQSQKSVFNVNVLLLFGARRTAMSLIPAAMKLATEFELTSDRIALLEAICEDASLSGLRKRFQQSDRDLIETLRLRNAEVEVASLLQHINAESVGRARPSLRARRLAETSPNAARAIFREFPTFIVGLAYYRIAIGAAQMNDNFELGLNLCEEAQKFLSRFPKLHTPASQGEIESNRLWMALSSRSFEAAAESAARCEKLFREGTNNWFIAREYEFLLKMHTKEWSEAIQLQKFIISHLRFLSQPDQVKQKWELFGYYAALTSGTKHSSIPTPKKSFVKVLREVPVYRKEKIGYNASLLILQFLILASRGDQMALIEKSESMSKYIYRHFDGQHERHTYAFIKALTILADSDFDIEKSSKKAKKYIEQFTSIERERVDESQVLPYDMMWEWIREWIEISPKFRGAVQTSKMGGAETQ